ncbi:MAG: hypothetical protein HQ567_20030 [Candidatus Nealsonbacteria bacterium]|nr:hypothetical protein [Candidatus Nealsonbacteria bacterium]
MKKTMLIRGLFLAAAVFETVLGLAFLSAPDEIFERFSVEPPNHWGYVQFPAAVLLIFAWMFLVVALRPEARRHLIPYGILLKLSFAGIVLRYWFDAGVPGLWKPLAIIDLATAALFAWAYVTLIRGKDT